MKELLYGNEVAESTFRERLRTLEIDGETVNKPSKKENFFFLPKSNSYVTDNSGDISYNQFPSSTLLCPQDLGHDLSIISEEIEALDKTINQSLQCITRDPPKECVCIVIRNFKVIENKYTRNKEQETNAGSKENNDVVGKLLEIEHLWKDNLHLHRSGKDLLMNNFLRSLNNFFKEN